LQVKHQTNAEKQENSALRPHGMQFLETAGFSCYF